jgi:hypothetical protein
MRLFNLLMLCLLLGTTPLHAQDKKMLMKSWIKQKIVGLQPGAYTRDTIYTRLTFIDNDFCVVSSNPLWNTETVDWATKGDFLKVGLVIYHVDTLTDSTLVLSEPGRRRIYFTDEKLLSNDSSLLIKDSVWNGEPVYKATARITPRYGIGEFNRMVLGALHNYDLDMDIKFKATFIVGKDGSVNDVQVISGSKDKYDKAMVKAIESSSNDWTPATVYGRTIQTRVTFSMIVLKPFQIGKYTLRQN